MKIYYMIGCGAAVLAFFLTMFIVGMVSCGSASGKKSDVEDIAENTVVVRYYMSDDYDNAEVKYMTVTPGADFRLSSIPHKDGYNLSGLYDDEDFNRGTLYIDSNGNSLITVTSDILLYPVFVKVGA